MTVIARYRAGTNAPDPGSCVWEDDERVIAETATLKDAEVVAAALNQHAGAVEAMELARVELDTALGFLDAAATFKGKRSVRLCIVRARHFIRGQ